MRAARLLFDRAETLKRKFREAGLPVMESSSHIVPLMIGDAAKATAVSMRLIREYGMYATPINYPTVTARHGAPALHAGPEAHRRDDGRSGRGAGADPEPRASRGLRGPFYGIRRGYFKTTP